MLYSNSEISFETAVLNEGHLSENSARNTVFLSVITSYRYGLR